MIKKLLLALLALTVSAGSAQAQPAPPSNGPFYGPNWSQGYVPTAQEWQRQWTNKVGYYVGGIPIVYGGTGATNAAAALVNIGGMPNNLLSGLIFVGSSSNVAAARTLSGDCSLTNLGVISCTKTGGVSFGYFATGTAASNLTGTVANARLVGTGSTTVNGQTCTLGSTCTVTAAASTIAIGTPITGGTTTRVLYDSAGALGEYAVSGTGSVCMTAGCSIDLGSGTGLPLAGVTGTWTPARGGTGATGVPTNGQLLIGNGTNYTVASLTAGSGITVTPGSGTISIAATGSGGALTNNKILLGNGSNVAAEVSVTGDCTTANTGAVTCTKTGGTNFAAVATSGSATDLTTGTLPAARISGNYALASSTATTQSAADNSTKVATTAYADAAVASAVPSGATFPYAGLTAPTGYLMANGQAVSRSTYAALFSAITSTATVTITIASPGVVTWTSHGFSAGMAVVFSTTGALPTGITAGTTYYTLNVAANTFQVAASAGGAAINTTGSQSGVQTALAVPYGKGDGSTTFNVPDLRGRSAFGDDTMANSAASRLGSNSSVGGITSTASLGTAGGAQTHTQTTPELAAHTHNYNTLVGGNDYGSAAGYGLAATTTTTTGSSTPFNITPPALVMNYIIKQRRRPSNDNNRKRRHLRAPTRRAA